MKKMFQLLLGLLVVIVIALAALVGYGEYEAYQVTRNDPMEEVIRREMASSGYTDDLPSFLLEATVAVEDDQFYSHPGVDFPALARGLLSQVFPFVYKSGGSTITQQVVKNLYQKYNAGWSWKPAEIVLSFRLERLLDKDEILDLYVNIINYGDGYIGIEQAAMGYFGVTPAELNDAECTILAGIPQSPANLQLSTHPQQAKGKQRIVLKAMLRNGMIDEARAQEIWQTPIDYMADGQWQQIVSQTPLL